MEREVMMGPWPARCFLGITSKTLTKFCRDTRKMDCGIESRILFARHVAVKQMDVIYAATSHKIAVKRIIDIKDRHRRRPSHIAHRASRVGWGDGHYINIATDVGVTVTSCYRPHWARRGVQVVPE